MMPSWRERVVEARARGSFTRQEKAMADGSWQMCKVGEERQAHPEVVIYRDGDTWWSGPVDPVLRELGSAFSGFGAAVAKDDFDRAELYIDQIEARVLVLKREYRATSSEGAKD